MLRVDDVDGALAWLVDLDPGGAFCGFDPPGWEANTWLLNAMYENVDRESTLTYDQARRADVASGTVAPVVVGGHDLDDDLTLVGSDLGLNGWPGPGWKRLRWSELVARVPCPMERSGVPPSFRWFPFNSWPLSLVPPPEGSLDIESLTALLDVLSDAGTDGLCWGYWSPGAGGGLTTPRVFRVALPEIVPLSESEGFSPSNLWPEDHSWFVYTDYDFSGTKVSGPRTLIDAIEAHPELETRRLHL